MFCPILAFPMPRRKNGQIAGTARSFIQVAIATIPPHNAKRNLLFPKFAICIPYFLDRAELPLRPNIKAATLASQTHRILNNHKRPHRCGARHSCRINIRQSDRTIFLLNSVESGGASVLASRERSMTSLCNRGW